MAAFNFSTVQVGIIFDFCTYKGNAFSLIFKGLALLFFFFVKSA